MLTWLRNNKTLSIIRAFFVFDAVIVKKINDERHGVQESIMVGNAVKNKKNHWLQILLKYSFIIVYAAATTNITGLASQLIVDFVKKD